MQVHNWSGMHRLRGSAHKRKPKPSYRNHHRDGSSKACTHTLVKLGRCAKNGTCGAVMSYKASRLVMISTCSWQRGCRARRVSGATNRCRHQGPAICHLSCCPCGPAQRCGGVPTSNMTLPPEDALALSHGLGLCAFWWLQLLQNAAHLVHGRRQL